MLTTSLDKSNYFNKCYLCLICNSLMGEIVFDKNYSRELERTQVLTLPQILTLISKFCIIFSDQRKCPIRKQIHLQ